MIPTVTYSELGHGALAVAIFATSTWSVSGSSLDEAVVHESPASALSVLAASAEVPAAVAASTWLGRYHQEMDRKRLLWSQISAEDEVEDVVHDGPEWRTPPSLLGKARLLSSQSVKGAFPSLGEDELESWGIDGY